MEQYNININGTTFTIDRDNIAWGDGEHHSTAYMLDAISRHGVKDKTVLANLHWMVQFENVKTVANVVKDDGVLIMTWKNFTKFEDHVKGFEIIEHMAGEDYDGYVLRKLKK